MWRHKMLFLELCGHLLHITAFAEECQGKIIATRIDNDGSVVMWRKGYDLKCPINNSLIRAADHVATAIGCAAYVVGIVRRSTWGAVAADALSKSDFKEFGEVMLENVGKIGDARPVPLTFLAWLENPVVDKFLGQKIVDELAA